MDKVTFDLMKSIISIRQIAKRFDEHGHKEIAEAIIRLCDLCEQKTRTGELQ